MLGIILLIVIGKYFYKLAEDFDKNKWGYAILGIAGYYAGTIIGGIILGLILVFIYSDIEIESMSENRLGLIALPFGLISAYILHYFLKKKWKKEREIEKGAIDNIGKD